MKLPINRSFIIVVILLTMQILLANWLTGFASMPIPAGWQIVLSIGLSVVPAVCWLYFFVVQDFYEKESYLHLSGMFIFGLVMAFGFSMSLERLFAQSHPGILNASAATLPEAILVFGCIHELTKFLILRYTVYQSSEFNEPADGVFYAIAVSLGFATAYNIVYFMLLPAISPTVVLIRITEFYLVNAITGGFMGYFIGKAKFDSSRRENWMVTGFLITAFLTGIYEYTADSLHKTGTELIKNLIISEVIILFFYGIMSYLLQKFIAVSRLKSDSEK